MKQNYFRTLCGVVVYCNAVLTVPQCPPPYGQELIPRSIKRKNKKEMCGNSSRYLRLRQSTLLENELKTRCILIHSFFFYKNVVFPAQAEYSYFSADFRLKIFLYYS